MNPEPVLLQHLPRDVAERLDALYGRPTLGSVTIHKPKHGGKVKFEIREFEEVETSSS